MSAIAIELLAVVGQAHAGFEGARESRARWFVVGGQVLKAEVGSSGRQHRHLLGEERTAFVASAGGIGS
jgi:hypothetical protein